MSQPEPRHGYRSMDRDPMREGPKDEDDPWVVALVSERTGEVHNYVGDLGDIETFTYKRAASHRAHLAERRLSGSEAELRKLSQVPEGDR